MKAVLGPTALVCALLSGLLATQHGLTCAVDLEEGDDNGVLTGATPHATKEGGGACDLYKDKASCTRDCTWIVRPGSVTGTCVMKTALSAEKYCNNHPDHESCAADVDTLSTPSSNSTQRPLTPPPVKHKYCVVGAGPAGIQMGQ